MKAEELIGKFGAGLLDFLSKAGDFVNTQAPLYIQELLRYEAIIAIVWMVFWMIATAVFLRCACVYFIKNKKNEDGLYEFLIAVFVVLTMASSAFIFMNASSLIKIQVAPRVFLLENIKSTLT